MTHYYFPVFEIRLDPDDLLHPKLYKRIENRHQYIIDSTSDEIKAWLQKIPKKFTHLISKVYDNKNKRKTAPHGLPILPTTFKKKPPYKFTYANLITSGLIRYYPEKKQLDLTNLNIFLKKFKEEWWRGVPKKYNPIESSEITEAIRTLIQYNESEQIKDNASFDLSTVNRIQNDSFIYDIRGWLYPPTHPSKLLELKNTLIQLFKIDPNGKLSVTLTFIDGTVSDPPYILDAYNFNEFKDKLGKTFNKGYKADDYNALDFLDKNNQFFINFTIEIIDKEVYSNPKKQQRRHRRYGGFVNLIMRKEFINQQPKELVNFMKDKLGISTYNKIFLHQSCIVVAIFNSNISHLLTEKTKYTLAKYSTTIFYNFDIIDMEKKLLPILRDNDPPIKSIELRHVLDPENNKYKSVNIKNGIEKFGVYDYNTSPLQLGCVENHYFPDLIIDNFEPPYKQFQERKFNKEVTTITFMNNIFKYLDKIEGLSPFTSEELLKHLDIERMNYNVKNILENKFDIKIEPFTIFKGIENQFKTKISKKKSPAKLVFDDIIYFDTETAPDPTNNNIQTFYLGVAKFTNDGSFIVNTDTPKTFVKQILRKVGEGRRILAIAHNITFDLPFLLEGCIYPKKHLTRNGKVVTGEYIYPGGISITVLDSWRLTNCSLDAAAKAFKIPQQKTSFPHHILQYTPEWLKRLKPEVVTRNLSASSDCGEDITQWNGVQLGTLAIEYCKNDCIVLEGIMKQYQKQLTDLCETHALYPTLNLFDYYSLPSISFKIAELFGATEGLLFETPIVFEGFLKTFMSAGRTIMSCVERGDGKRILKDKLIVNDEVSCVDVVSLYPAAAVKMGGFPSTSRGGGGEPVFLTNLSFQDFFKIKRKYPHFILGITPNSESESIILNHLDLPVLSSIKTTQENSVRCWTNELKAGEVYPASNFCLTSLASLSLPPSTSSVSSFTLLDSVALVKNWGESKNTEYLEMKLAFNLDKYIKIKVIMFYPNSEMNDNFGRLFIPEMYKYKADKSHPLNFIAKLLLNSCIGKFSTKSQEIGEKLIKNKDINDTMLRSSSFICINKFNNNLSVLKYRDYSSNQNIKNYSINNIFIWSCARWMMNMYAARFTILGSDTDSLIIYKRDLRDLEHSALKIGLITQPFNDKILGSMSNDLHCQETFESVFCITFIPLFRKGYFMKLVGGSVKFRLKGVSDIAILSYCKQEGITVEELYIRLASGGGYQFNEIVEGKCKMKRTSDGHYKVLKECFKTITVY